MKTYSIKNTKSYSKNTLEILRNFDISITDELRTKIRDCKTEIEVDRIRMTLISKQIGG